MSYIQERHIFDCIAYMSQYIILFSSCHFIDKNLLSKYILKFLNNFSSTLPFELFMMLLHDIWPLKSYHTIFAKYKSRIIFYSFPTSPYSILFRDSNGCWSITLINIIFGLPKKISTWKIQIWMFYCYCLNECYYIMLWV